MLFSKQPLSWAFLCHKSAITFQNDSCNLSNSKLALDLCNCIKTEMVESKAPPQQPHKRGTIFLVQSVDIKGKVAFQTGIFCFYLHGGGAKSMYYCPWSGKLCQTKAPFTLLRFCTKTERKPPFLRKCSH